MGNTIWVEVRGRPVKETANDSSTMYRLMDNLDALAQRLGVAKLSGFYDFSALEEAYGDLDETDDDDSADEETAEEERELTLEERQAKGEWFDSAEGLKAIRALRQRLAEHFDELGFTPSQSTGHWPKQLMDELTITERILEAAAASQQDFRLLIVP